MACHVPVYEWHLTLALKVARCVIHSRNLNWFLYVVSLVLNLLINIILMNYPWILSFEEYSSIRWWMFDLVLPYIVHSTLSLNCGKCADRIHVTTFVHLLEGWPSKQWILARVMDCAIDSSKVTVGPELLLIPLCLHIPQLYIWNINGAHSFLNGREFKLLIFCFDKVTVHLLARKCICLLRLKQDVWLLLLL